jgi:hypothetical protein
VKALEATPEESLAEVNLLVSRTVEGACIDGRKAMANWSLCGRHVGPDKPPTPVFINLDNVLTVERQGDLTTVVMLGGETIYIDTMPETLIGAVAPAGPV